MSDYTKIKAILSDPSYNTKKIETEPKENITFDSEQYEYNLSKIDDNDIVYARIKCLQLFEEIKDITRDIFPPLFDKLTIEDLMELLYPELGDKIYS